MQKEYTGSVYLGSVGPETEVGICRDSVMMIKKREGDEGPYFVRATKGYEARQFHINKFIESPHDFILLLDHDQIFPADCLERLRSHKRPFVSGFYMRRRFAPIAPVWFEYDEETPPRWPMMPFTRDVPQDELVKLGASGWGCILIHRDVILAVSELLKGEDEVIEDDMDIFPYDLPDLLRAVNRLAQLSAKSNLVDFEPEDYDLLRSAVDILRENIVPLRGTKDPVGSDLRFPFFARLAGFDLYGDPAVRVGHVLNYPLSPDDYAGVPTEEKDKLGAVHEEKVSVARAKWRSIVSDLERGIL